MEKMRRAVGECHHADNARVTPRGWILQKSEHEMVRERIESRYYPGRACLVYDIWTFTI
jgi:hypothetical protein